MISRPKFLTSANIVSNRLFPERCFFHNLEPSIICSRLSYILTFKLVKTEIDFRDRREKKYVPEITDLLRYWPMLEICGGKALEYEPILVFFFHLKSVETKNNTHYSHQVNLSYQTHLIIFFYLSILYGLKKVIHIY